MSLSKVQFLHGVPLLATCAASGAPQAHGRMTPQEASLEMTVSVDFTAAADERLARHEGGLFLGPLSVLARQKKTWSPVLLAGVLWRAATNVRTHREILRLLKLPALAELAQANPRFAFKYLTHNYLVREFTVAERAASFMHHYRRLHQLLPDGFLRQILMREMLLAEFREGDNRFSVTLGFSRTHDKEGELSLNLEVDGEMVFILSFTIVPGWVAKSKAADVLLITRIQGVKGCYRQISAATKTLFDVAPAALLLAALQGAGEAFGIGEMAAICGTSQNSWCEECAHGFKTAYDDFFEELGVQKNEANLYLSAIPLEEKPLTLIKQGHKLRTREKREFKRKITNQVCDLLRERSLFGSESTQSTELRHAANSLQDLNPAPELLRR